MDKADDYNKSIKSIQDATIYEQLRSDQTNKPAPKINSTIKRIQDAGELTDGEREKMKVEESKIAKFYGLINILLRETATEINPINTQEAYIHLKKPPNVSKTY